MSEIERHDPFDGKLGFALANRVGEGVGKRRPLFATTGK
jgi:hypothetical protein